MKIEPDSATKQTHDFYECVKWYPPGHAYMAYVRIIHNGRWRSQTLFAPTEGAANDLLPRLRAEVCAAAYTE